CSGTPRSARWCTSTSRALEQASLTARRIAKAQMLAELSPAWDRLIDAFDAELRRQAVAANTRRAYRADATQFARWATERGLEPTSLDVRSVRRFAASLSEHGSAPATVARKLASLRRLFQADIERGGRVENPADFVSTPKRPHRL